MTLLVAKKSNGNITLSSDTRITFGDDQHFDYGIKLFSTEMNFKNGFVGYIDRPYIHPKLPNDAKYHIGLGMTGSYMAASTVKESISSLLQRLFIMGPQTDLSFKGVAGMILRVYEAVTCELARTSFERAHCEMVIVGHCHIENRPLALHFSIKDRPGDTKKFSFDEILMQDGILCFGSGKNVANNILATDPDISPMRLIKKVIKEKLHNEVGGGIQHGSMYGSNFLLTAVQDPDVKPVFNDDGEITYDSKTYLRSTPHIIDPLEKPWLATGSPVVGLDHQ
ncbi:hypothetical protein [Dyadobacter sp. 22481]|uniref:hypothetical protein n=1 Tax=Dyadobacter sp. 22481 TaxID=3453926 RepID=UPI003F84F9B2